MRFKELPALCVSRVSLNGLVGGGIFVLWRFEAVLVEAPFSQLTCTIRTVFVRIIFPFKHYSAKGHDKMLFLLSTGASVALLPTATLGACESGWVNDGQPKIAHCARSWTLVAVGEDHSSGVLGCLDVVWAFLPVGK